MTNCWGVHAQHSKLSRMTATTDSTKPDMSTTAGKIADLRNRLAEARAPMGKTRSAHATMRAGSRHATALRRYSMKAASWKLMR